MDIGIGHNKPPVRDTSGVRSAVLDNRARSVKQYPHDTYYRVDRFRSDYMSLQPKWERKVWRYLEELEATGERVVYADICGRSTTMYREVAITYCFALHTDEMRRIIHPKQNVIVDGDIFSMRDFYSFLALMRDKGDRPAFVTFCPIAGLQSYSPRHFPEDERERMHALVTWQRLENNLRKLLETIRPGGYVYIDRPFQLADPDLGDWFRRKETKEYSSVRWMKAFCKGKKCSMEFERDIGGVKFLLRKWAQRKPRKAAC